MNDPLIIEPVRGHWHWPFREMEIGDWFLVAHKDREPGSVRNLAGVTAHRLGRAYSFSVVADDPEFPNHTRVTRVEPNSRNTRLPKIDFATLNGVIDEAYGYTLDVLPIPWEADWEVGQEFFLAQRRIFDPQQVRFVMWKRGTGIRPTQWSFEIELKEDGIRICRRPDGFTQQDLQRELELLS